MDFETLKQCIKLGDNLASQPLVFNGGNGSGKHFAALTVADDYADQKNVFTVTIGRNGMKTMQSDFAVAKFFKDLHSFLNAKEDVSTLYAYRNLLANSIDAMEEKNSEFYSSLEQAAKAINEGELAALVIDVDCDELDRDIQFGLLSLITSGRLSYGKNKQITLDDDKKDNLLIMIVKGNEVELSEPLDCRCMNVYGYNQVPRSQVNKMRG